MIDRMRGGCFWSGRAQEHTSPCWGVVVEFPGLSPSSAPVGRACSGPGPLPGHLLQQGFNRVAGALLQVWALLPLDPTVDILKTWRATLQGWGQVQTPHGKRETSRLPLNLANFSDGVSKFNNIVDKIHPGQERLVLCFGVSCIKGLGGRPLFPGRKRTETRIEAGRCLWRDDSLWGGWDPLKLREGLGL